MESSPFPGRSLVVRKACGRGQWSAAGKHLSHMDKDLRGPGQ